MFHRNIQGFFSCNCGLARASDWLDETPVYNRSTLLWEFHSAGILCRAIVVARLEFLSMH